MSFIKVFVVSATFLLTPFVACAQAPSTDADQGLVFAPKFAPDDLSVISYERQQEDTRQIIIRLSDNTELKLAIEDDEVDSRKSNEFADLLRLEKRESPKRFDTSFEWRPSLSPSGIRWFAFVSATRATGTRLIYVNGLHADNTLVLDAAIPLPTPGPVTEIDWSPTGRRLVASLAVRSESGDPGVDLFVSSRFTGSDLVNAEKSIDWFSITRNLEIESSPAWNKSSDRNANTIAYRTESRDSNVQSIVVVSLENWNEGDIPNPVKISGDLDGFALYKPSWSHDGQYIAAYASSKPLAESTGDQQLQDVVVFDILAQSFQDGRSDIAGGRLLTNRLNMDRVATNVVPAESDGPQWVPTDAEDGFLIAFVEKTDGFPIKYADVSAFLANELDESRLQIQADFEQASQSKELTVGSGAGLLHFAYSSQENGFPRLTTTTIPFESAQLKIRQDLERLTALKKSLTFPGRGQAYKGQIGKARFFKYGGISLGAITLVSYSRFAVLWIQGSDKRSDARDTFVTSFGLTALLYAANTVDSWLGFPVQREVILSENGVSGDGVKISLAFAPGRDLVPVGRLAVTF